MGQGAAQEAALCAARSQAGLSQHLSSSRMSHTASLLPLLVVAHVPRASALPVLPHVWTSALHDDTRMSFSTDTAWPQGLCTIFEIFRQRGKPFANRYYGPYDKLLNYCFGNSFQYFIELQSPPSDLNLPDTVDFERFMVVFNVNRCPVLIAEIKDDGWAHRADLRFKADDQIRRRYDAMLGNCPLPRLWGLSLLGTSLRVYCGTVTTGSIKPNFVPRPDPSRILAPDFLEGAWDIDILSPEGFNKMKEIIMDVLAAAAAL
jgi:hypothetical protein